MCSQKLRKKTNHLFVETKMTNYVLQLYIYRATFYGFHMISKFVLSQCLRSDTFAQWLLLELWQNIKCLTLGQNIYQLQMASWKFSQVHVGEEIQSSNHLHVHSLQPLCKPTKMYYRHSWHVKNTWCFSYLFLRSMICWNQIEETLYHHLIVLLQDIGTKWWLLLVSGTVFDFAKQSSRSAWTLTITFWVTPKNVIKVISLSHRSSVVGSSKFGHVGVFVNCILQHVQQIPQNHGMVTFHD